MGLIPTAHTARVYMLCSFIDFSFDGDNTAILKS